MDLTLSSAIFLQVPKGAVRLKEYRQFRGENQTVEDIFSLNSRKKERQLMQRKTIVANLIALFLLTSAAVFGASGDKTKVKGIITSRTGETLIVGSAEGTSVTVVLTDSTVTKDDKGLFGLDKQHLSSVVLI